MREIVFDTETTGFNPADGHRLVEIGCVELVNRVETGRTFHAYFNPGRAMPAEAEAVHGLSDRFLSDKPFFPDGVRELLEFLGDAPLVAHNATFDFTFLNAELGWCGHDAICLTRMVDTLALARQKHPGAKHSLDALCSRYGIDRSHRVKHGALLDAQLLAQLYVELTGGRQIGLSLRNEPAADASSDVRAVPILERRVARPLRPARPHAPSEEEIIRHQAFVSKLSNPLWESAGPPG
ncbi:MULTISPECIES: DNA polymerase III subunit epsilon [Sphingomonadales]|uniref:DNA polymerase III subunit epsilon n=1 Tax=Edaphosphingomonas haloaromaticamans TaxID=653954 RepID=A0A1S1H7Q3_9SPHN|nr:MULTISPECIES: DNA polymerase III subunit epsilon [Sphingomonas]AGH49770.1 DNA polymerase III subunit epsilon [Sphingomonas sp. MM-1]MDX3885768.1 DNA polymerase III subunit epsilon [Sphingomonas sp.]OHT18085.1 DNA polymerase III subunit epsilon [Sphingomonas haloaromaticamans]